MNVPREMAIINGKVDLRHVEELCLNGLSSLQLRDKELSTIRLLELALALRKITQQHGAQLIINDRTDIAMAVYADGVHLPEKSLTPDTVKSLCKPLLIGVSIHSLESGLHAQQHGADYVMFGPVYETPFKHPLGLTMLRVVASCLSIPVLAVGGINNQNAQVCIDAGAHGFAAIRAFEQVSPL